MSSEPRKIVLVDMDGVICDFDIHMFNEFRRLYPNEPYVLPTNRKKWAITDQYDALKRGLGQCIWDIMQSQHFFETLPPMAGAVQALTDMAKLANVFLCTTPLLKYRHCVVEKYNWVNKYLGSEFISKIILTHDKTLVHGDILIDDKPYITGAKKPTWEHILFSQPYNENICDHQPTSFSARLSSWTNEEWKSLL